MLSSIIHKLNRTTYVRSFSNKIIDHLSSVILRIVNLCILSGVFQHLASLQSFIIGLKNKV